MNREYCRVSIDENRYQLNLIDDEDLKKHKIKMHMAMMRFKKKMMATRKEMKNDK